MSLLALRYCGAGEFQAIHPGLADKLLVTGEVKAWEIVEPRSGKSHRHYFSVINEAWQNLPEHLVDEFPNPEALRKFALIKAGYSRKAEIVCANNGEAVKLAGHAREGDEYCVVVIEGKLVKIWRAKSQSVKSMGKQEFQESKDAALHVISVLIGTDAATLERSQAA